MKKIICNPYLPGKEYVPDGEPYIFDDRLYVFGSHDEFGADNYCTGSYVGWSAPLDDLSDWKYEGVILEKGQDPMDPEGNMQYYAPDVAKGPDGRYYLYYSIEGSHILSVAVSDTPAGKYQFYGHIKDKNGHVLGSSEGDTMQFDPAVLVDDDGRIYLYSGQGMPTEVMDGRKVMGSQVCELETDMLTAKTEQKVLTSRTEHCFEENPFFEASSIRKLGNTYYFIYSPLPNVHNLCYATSQYPDREFEYQGVLVSNGGIVSSGTDAQRPEYYWGNNHGSLLEMNGELYIFYHRHTNKTPWNRQGCVEHLTIKNGKIEQAVPTSMGLRSEPFPFKAAYSAYMACILKKKEMDVYVPFQFLEFSEADPYITQDETAEVPYIANMREGSAAGYRYFCFDGEECSVWVEIRGNGEGMICISGEKQGILAQIPVKAGRSWKKFSRKVNTDAGKDTLYITYQGTGYVDLLCFGAE